MSDTTIEKAGERPEMEAGPPEAPKPPAPRSTEAGPLRLLLTSNTLRAVLAMVTHDAKEDMVFLSGFRADGRIVVEQPMALRSEKRSGVFVKPDSASVGEVLVANQLRGFVWPLHAHSHPGGGHNHTRPSAIDLDFQSKLELGGYSTIGLIATRDGCVRFFSWRLDFEVEVLGHDVWRASATELELNLDFASDLDERLQNE